MARQIATDGARTDLKVTNCGGSVVFADPDDVDAWAQSDTTIELEEAR